jgi:hypothetical protein
MVAISRDGTLKLQVTMPVGARVTGWVAANGTCVVNADASLDLLDDAKPLGLRRCLAIPILHNVEPLGVMSLYMDDPRGFSERDSVIVEAAIKAVDLRALRDFMSSLSEPHPLKKTPTTVH